MNKWASWLSGLVMVFLFSGVGWADNLNDLYDTLPDVPSCYEGVLKSAEKEKAFAEVNRIRALAHLPLVTYNSGYDDQMAKSSLIISANMALSHTPSTSDSCYSTEGYEGSSTSNLYKGETYSYSYLSSSASHIQVYLIDLSVDSLGHRRWILDPFLKYVSYGRVDGHPTGSTSIVTGSALKVMFNEMQDLSGTTLSFIAYPCGYYPPDLVDLSWYWSFSVLADPLNKYDNDEVDFSQATITVTGAGGQMTVTNQGYDTTTYGLPNILKWMVPDAQQEETYHVVIGNVIVDGTAKTYEYDVTITTANSGGCPNTSDGGDDGGDDGGSNGDSGTDGGGGGGGCFLSTL